jgi:uncharacterized protein (UPF0303 family)
MSKLSTEDKQALLEKVQAVDAQEAELVFASFDSTTAWDLGHLFIPEAEKRGYHLALRISMGEQILFQFSMNGTKAGQEVWLDRKMRTVYEFGESTERVGLYHEYMGRDFYETPWIDPFTTTKHGGGFPIRLNNSTAVIGALALSGAHGEEHGFIVEMLRKYLASK